MKQRARATLQQIQAMYGCEPFDAKRPPEIIRVNVMGRWLHWTRVPGAKNVYEQRDEEG